MVIGLVSLYACVGCGSAQESASSSVENSVESSVEQKEPTEGAETPTTNEAKTAEVEPEVDPAVTNAETAKEQIQALSSLIGKKAEEVDAILGQPVSIQNLEDSDILLVRYYRVPYLNETAKIEVIFNDNEQVVNYVSFMVLKADNIASSKEILVDALTQLHGESTIERYVDVKGKQNRNWQDETLTYELNYYENNISLDIYPTDK